MGKVDFILAGIPEDDAPDWSAAEAAINQLTPDPEDPDWEALVDDYLDPEATHEEQVRRARHLLYQDLAEFRIAMDAVDRYGEHRVLSVRSFRDRWLYVCGGEEGTDLPGLYHSMLRLLRADVLAAAGFER